MKVIFKGIIFIYFWLVVLFFAGISAQAADQEQNVDVAEYKYQIDGSVKGLSDKLMVEVVGTGEIVNISVNGAFEIKSKFKVGD